MSLINERVGKVKFKIFHNNGFSLMSHYYRFVDIHFIVNMVNNILRLQLQTNGNKKLYEVLISIKSQKLPHITHQHSHLLMFVKYTQMNVSICTQCTCIWI